jgi:hypothetical protein
MRSKVKEVLDKYPGFEPSSDCKEKLLGTRKIPVEYGGIEYPGFFSVDDNLFRKRDKPAFISMVILELIGIISIFLISKPAPFIYLIKGILISFLVLLEILLAGYFHKSQYYKYVVAKNKLSLIENNEFADNWPLNQKKKVKKAVNKHIAWTMTCLIFLFIIAVAKTLLITVYEVKDVTTDVTGLQLMDRMMPLIQIVGFVIFVVVGYLLWMSYGYYRNYKIFYRCFAREAAEHIEGIGKFKLQYEDFLIGKSPRPLSSDCYAYMKRTRRQSWNEKIYAKFSPFDYISEGSLLNDHTEFFNNNKEINLLAEFVKAQYKDTIELEPENDGGYNLSICYNGLLTDHELETISNQGNNVVTRKLLGNFGLKFQIMMHADESDFEIKT